VRDSRFWQTCLNGLKDLSGTQMASSRHYFYMVNIFFIFIKTIFDSLGTFYDLRDAGHCQPYFRGTSIPRSSIGDILPCVKPAVQTEFTELH
jgi:hypothetical protein